MALSRASIGLLRSHIPRQTARIRTISTTPIRRNGKMDDLGGPGGQQPPPQNPGGPEAIRRNWLPIGGGVLTLLAAYAYFTRPGKAEKAGAAAKDAVEDARLRAREAAHDARDKAKDMTDEARAKAREAAGKAQDVAGDVRDKARDAADKTKDVAGDMRDKARDVAQDTRSKAKGAADDARAMAKDAAKNAEGRTSATMEQMSGRKNNDMGAFRNE